ncbi:MAG: EutP/PduV family microcompartment system protein [Oscillospiraceae bacterium]|nr:EutP/PduV family microcompartment system protein [Oscillospiraceae bacterium]
MKKIMLIGKVGAGKTTLCQRIYNLDMTYKKTQAVEIVGGTAIDTPGEYLEHKSYLKALLVSGVDADLVLFLHDVNDDQFSFSPRTTTMFNRPALGVVTKIDECRDPRRPELVADALRYAGASPIFFISSITGEGVRELLDYIEAM